MSAYVEYFDQHLGVAHPKSFIFNIFCAKKLKKH